MKYGMSLVRTLSQELGIFSAALERQATLGRILPASECGRERLDDEEAKSGDDLHDC